MIVEKNNKEGEIKHMLFTERKGLEEMFSYLEQDKRAIKAQARQDIENIENRQMQILDRLQRLDDIEREAVDVEGVLHQLANTTQELGKLIPTVPFADVLERAAQLVADRNGERINLVDPNKTIMREKIVEAARVQKVTAPPKKKFPAVKPGPKGLKNDQGIKIIMGILEKAGRPLSTNEIKSEFEEITELVYTNFYYKLKTWTEKSKGRIVKDPIKKLYYLKETKEHEQRTNERAETKESKEETLI